MPFTSSIRACFIDATIHPISLNDFRRKHTVTWLSWKLECLFLRARVPANFPCGKMSDDDGDAEFDMEEEFSVGEELSEDGRDGYDDGGGDDFSKDEANQTVHEVLCGNVNSVPGQHSSVYRIFLSSTFTGFNNFFFKCSSYHLTVKLLNHRNKTIVLFLWFIESVSNVDCIR